MQLTTIRNYIINCEGACFRTQVAIRVLTLRAKEWRQYVQGQFEEDEQSETAADVMLWQRVLTVYDCEATSAITHIEDVIWKGTEIPASILATTLKRWIQMRGLIREAVSNSINKCTRALCLQEIDDRSSSITNKKHTT